MSKDAVFLFLLAIRRFDPEGLVFRCSKSRKMILSKVRFVYNSSLYDYICTYIATLCSLGNHNAFTLSDNNNTKEKTKMESDKTHSKKPGAITIDAANFLMLNLETDNMTSSNQETDRIMTIKSAFANDDVVQEFLKEKEELVEGDKHVETDLTLPGWGSWAGEGVKQNKKRKRTVKKLKPEVKRKDSDLKYVIISEERDTKIAKHQVRN